MVGFSWFIRRTLGCLFGSYVASAGSVIRCTMPRGSSKRTGSGWFTCGSSSSVPLRLTAPTSLCAAFPSCPEAGVIKGKLCPLTQGFVGPPAHYVTSERCNPHDPLHHLTIPPVKHPARAPIDSRPVTRRTPSITASGECAKRRVPVQGKLRSHSRGMPNIGRTAICVAKVKIHKLLGLSPTNCFTGEGSAPTIFRRRRGNRPTF